jgi:ankyrin repeat protein
MWRKARLKRDCDPQHGWTAAHFAAQAGHTTALQLLLAAGASVDSRSRVRPADANELKCTESQ